MPPNEVPDSDDESIIDDDPLTTSADQEVNPYSASASHTSQETTSALDINFDEFLTQSPNQRARHSQDDFQSKPEPHVATATQKTDVESKSTGSTERLRREIQHLQSHLLDVDGSAEKTDVSSLVTPLSESPNVAKLKRRRIATAQPGEVSSDILQNTSEGSRRKRARTETYSKKTRFSDRNGADFGSLRDGIFASNDTKYLPVGHEGPLQGTSSPEAPVNSFINPADMHVDMSVPIDPADAMVSSNLDESTNKKYHKSEKSSRHRHISCLRDETPSTVTTHSTMGGYQIYNIDYRNHNGHSAADANPFADELSQQLLDDEEPDVALASKELYKSTQSGSATEPATSLARVNSVHDDELANSADIASSPASARHITRAERSGVLTHDCGTDESKEAFSKGLTQNKRSRKRTNTVSSRNSEQLSPGLGDSIEISEGVLDCDRNATPAPKKRGRKPKPKDPVVSSHVDEQENPLQSLQSDDLDVGLPKEQYKPRPSRSRGGTSEALFQEPTAPSKRPDEKKVDASVNLPSSEPNLSDEISIGIPKEQYKPRPSRSRSKRTEDLEDDSPKKDFACSSQQSYESSAGMPPPPKRAKKVSKTKVKRAKTSAAFLKNSDMLDEEDKDVLWVDEKPASVKMQLPKGDFSLVKKEKTQCEEELSEDSKDAVNANEDVDKGSIDIASKNEIQKARLAVEIPPPDPPPAVQGPKKRGRKRKKTDDTVVAEDQPAEQNDQDEESQQAPQKAEGLAATSLTERPSNNSESPPPPNRRPLTEKSSNIASGQGPVSESNRATATSFQENAQIDSSPPSPPDTPDKQQTTGAAASDKGPTKHSPIKTGSLFGSQYRVGLSRRQRIPRLLRIVRK